MIACFRDETWAETVEKLLIKAAQSDKPLRMTEVNDAETRTMILRRDGKAAWEKAAELLKSLPIHFHDAGRPLSRIAADFKSKHKLSLADAFAAALAKTANAQLVTGDSTFRALENEIRISWLIG